MPPALAPHTLLLFVLQLAVLLTAARGLGEVARRLGQPPVVGEILAGILLGPSGLGLLAPGLQTALFPTDQVQVQILQAVAWLGMILLLLMTGLETDLAVLRNLGRPALYASILGMAIPFAAALVLGLLLPAHLLVDPERRLLFALFLATALSISAIPVIARILIDLDLMRRNVGVVILGAGVTDDATGWLLLSMIAAVATRGELSLGTAVTAVGSAIALVAAVYLVGVRLVGALLRWIDDRVGVRHAMTTGVVVVTLAFGALAESIGVHAVFGAFLAGLAMARSPRVRRATIEQIESLLLAVFAPLFFAYAGLTVDLSGGIALGATLAILLVACAGKIVGAGLGAWLGGLGLWESFAVGAGMNARGAMGLVAALVGFSLGLLSAPLYAAVVLVALVTSGMAAPLLVWSSARIPVAADEAERLRRRAARARALLPTHGLKILLPTGGGHNAERAMALLAPLAAGDPDASIVAMHLERSRRPPARSQDVTHHLETLRRIAHEAGAPPPTVTRESGSAGVEAILREAGRGYDLLVLGASEVARRHPLGGGYIRRVAAATPCPLLVIRAGARERTGGTPPAAAPRGGRILVPLSDSAHGRAALEFAVLYAAHVRGTIVALHVIESSFAFFRRARAGAVEADLEAAVEALLRTAREQAEHAGVAIETERLEAANVERAIVKAAQTADLLLVGATFRAHARRALFGTRVETILTASPCPVAVLVLP